MPTWTYTQTPDKTADPYLEWTRVTGWQGHAAARRPDSWIPVLIQLKDPVRPENIDTMAIVSSGLVEVPGLYRCSGLSSLQYLTGVVARDRLDQLATSSDVVRFEFSLPVDAGATDQIAAARPGIGGVVIGVIDRGCAFLNGVFRSAWTGPGQQRTRIAALWDQTARADGNYWKPPVAAGYGRELVAEDINRLIARQRSGESEEALYRELRHPIDDAGRVAERVHGTHVLDTAAGLVPPFVQSASSKPKKPDSAQECSMVFVNLPTLAPGDDTGASTNAYILDGIHYILHRAGPGARVVINLSVGNQGGPHDGSSLLDRAMDDFLTSRPDTLAITVAAGNAADERWSTTGRVTTNAPERFSWRLMPHDSTDSFLEIWWAVSAVKPRSSPSLTLRITPPGGPAGICVLSGQGTALLVSDAGRPICRVAVNQDGALGDGPMALVAMAPTAGPRGTAPAGAWGFELSTAHCVANFDAWIQRDAPPFGTDDPVQSRFDDLPVDRPGLGNSLNSLACGKHVIAVGARRSSDGEESSYSSRKSATKVSKTRPRDVDWLAPADESATAIGLFCAGVLTGTVFRTGGTSIAAPAVARSIAEHMLKHAAPQRIGVLGGAQPTTYRNHLKTIWSKPRRP